MSDRKDLMATLVSRIIGLLSMFGIVTLSTQILGASGRGYISLLIADSALIAIFSNILSGSSAMFFLHKFGENKVFWTAFFWIVFSSLSCTLIVSLFQPVDFILLFFLSFSLSFNTLISNQLFANQQYLKGNILGLIVQMLFFLTLMFCSIVKINLTWEIYFQIQIFIWLILSAFFIKKLKFGILNFSELIEISKYGFRNELSYIFQFLSYRISYFFIYYKLGISDLGVFGVGIILAESIWVISKSVSSVSFAKQIIDNEEAKSINRTNKFALFSLYSSVLAILIVAVIPNYIFTLVFSKEFIGLKEIFLVMGPGILAIAVTNVFGHYFAAKNRQGVLILKSLIGFLVALILTPLLIDIYNLWGAALAMSISYITSSIVLLYAYFKNHKLASIS